MLQVSASVLSETPEERKNKIGATSGADLTPIDLVLFLH